MKIYPENLTPEGQETLAIIREAVALMNSANAGPANARNIDVAAKEAVEMFGRYSSEPYAEAAMAIFKRHPNPLFALMGVFRWTASILAEMGLGTDLDDLDPT